MKHFAVIAFYKFLPIVNLESLHTSLLVTMKKNNIKGTIILASEGINGSFAGQEVEVDAFIAYLKTLFDLEQIPFKRSYSDFNPFEKSKVKLKKEIVALGVDGLDPTMDTGTFVNPEEWNELIRDPNVFVMDNRNDYEVMLGTFKRSVNPKTVNFRDFPAYIKTLKLDKDTPIAMSCTGGIRCEKSSAYLKKLGYTNVYQLEGGILHYLEVIPEDESLWEGDCFVFDNRVALDAHLNSVTPGTIDLEWKNKVRQNMSEFPPTRE